MKTDTVEVFCRWDGRFYRRRLRRGLVTVAETADLLGVTTRTVWNLVARRALTPKRIRSRVLFMLSQVETQRLQHTGGHDNAPSH